MSPSDQREWLDVHTQDREIAAAAANSVAAHRARIAFHDPTAVDFRIRSIRCGEFGTQQVRMRGVEYRADCVPKDFLLAGALVDGRALLRTGCQEVALAPHDGFLHPRGVPYECDFRDPAVCQVRLPFAAAGDLAEETTGLSAQDLRFEAMTPVSGPMCRFWVGIADFLSRQFATPDADIPPILSEQLMRLAASAMLSVFPNTTMTIAHPPPGGRTAPTVVRRAIAHVDAHPDQPLTVAEIAAAAGVGARALQFAFRRHLDITPMGYLRRVRLERAHIELQAAEPGSGVTVSAIARRWGFANPSRFAAEYRAAHGQSPGRTLRT